MKMMNRWFVGDGVWRLGLEMNIYPHSSSLLHGSISSPLDPRPIRWSWCLQCVPYLPMNPPHQTAPKTEIGRRSYMCFRVCLGALWAPVRPRMVKPVLGFHSCCALLCWFRILAVEFAYDLGLRWSKNQSCSPQRGEQLSYCALFHLS